MLIRAFTIVARVTVQNASNHAQFLGTLDLEPTEDAAISRDGNLAPEADVGLPQVLKVLVRAVVDVYKRSRDIAVGRIAVERGDPVVKSTGRIILEDILLERSLKLNLPRLRGLAVVGCLV
jgi:hypothetical protein